jgi:sterol desaturase/sphingolipid hydroxylase (fatty acid hydroxylase superfamily)
LLLLVRYFYIHKKSHLNVNLAKQNVPWHWDHHMGKNQDANWGVTTDMWDLIMKTRIKHLEDLKE